MRLTVEKLRQLIKEEVSIANKKRKRLYEDAAAPPPPAYHHQQQSQVNYNDLFHRGGFVKGITDLASAKDSVYAREALMVLQDECGINDIDVENVVKLLHKLAAKGARGLSPVEAEYLSVRGIDARDPLLKIGTGKTRSI